MKETKINKLIKEVLIDPEGGAEPLKGKLSGFFSKHINKKDVLVYSCDKQKVSIIQCRFHYGDR